MINQKRKNLLRLSGVTVLILISFTLNILSSVGSANTLTFDYEFNTCSDCGLPSWDDNEINVSSVDQSIVFNQKLILNCAVSKNNLQLKLTESGENLTITEKFNYSVVASCNCPVSIIGSISNLRYKCYTLTFNLEKVQYNWENKTEVVSNRTILLDVIHLEMVTSSTNSAPSTSSTPLTNSSSSTSSKISDFTTIFPFITCLILLVINVKYKKLKK
ncbi:MAG: hypothetical protein ACXADY_25980 [Candidatus Hodarchaeales archaeon]